VIRRSRSFRFSIRPCATTTRGQRSAGLGEAFGFLPTLVVDGEGEQVAHARLELDGAVLMLGSASASGIYPAKTPRALGGITGSGVRLRR